MCISKRRHQAEKCDKKVGVINKAGENALNSILLEVRVKLHAHTHTQTRTRTHTHTHTHTHTKSAVKISVTKMWIFLITFIQFFIWNAKPQNHFVTSCLHPWRSEITEMKEVKNVFHCNLYLYYWAIAEGVHSILDLRCLTTKFNLLILESNWTFVQLMNGPVGFEVTGTLTLEQQM